MSLADASRIKALEQRVAELDASMAWVKIRAAEGSIALAFDYIRDLGAKVDALEKYIAEVDPVEDPEPPPFKRGPGRPRKDAIMKGRAKIGDAHFE